MNAFNVFLHRSHSLKYYTLVYVAIALGIAALVVIAEAFFIK